MPRVSARMAALCRLHDWSWYDLAGNCRLEIPGLLLRPRTGGANLGTPEAARVVRALLAAENAGGEEAVEAILERRLKPAWAAVR